MNIHNTFPSDYLKASDLNGRPFRLAMGRVTVEKVGDDERPVLHFQGADKGLVLNKTNANTIALIFGDETDNWFGHPIEVYPSETDYQGKRVACIRVRAVQQSQPAAQVPQQHRSYGGNPNLSPSKQAEAAADASPQQFTSQPAGFDDLDGPVPF